MNAASSNSARSAQKRACDRALATPLAPMNLRVFKQTFTVITEILLPLAREGIAIEPVSMPADPASARTRVFEGCPASVLRHRGWPHKGYKGSGEPPRVVREEIVRLLRKDGLEIASQTAVEAIHGGTTTLPPGLHLPDEVFDLQSTLDATERLSGGEVRFDLRHY